MKETLKQYLQKHFALDHLLGVPPNADSELGFNKYKLSGSRRLVMYALQISPYLCGILFAITFLFPLLVSPPVLQMAEGYGIFPFIENLSQFYIQNEPIFKAVLTVSVSGLIGYGTNYIAIRMLFRPVKKRPIWGQGLIPAQRDRIIYTLAQGMHKHILNQQLIRKRIEESGIVKRLNDLLLDGTISLLADEELREFLKKIMYEAMSEYANQEHFRTEIRHAIDARLDQKIEGGVKRLLFQTYKRYNKEEYDQAIDNIVKEIPKVAIEVVEKLETELMRVAAFIRLKKRPTEEYIMKLIMDILNRIDITGLLAKQMEHFDEARLERMVWEATNEQLLYIQYLGTVLGVLGGFLIWDPPRMGAIYLLGFGLLYLLDVFIYRMKKQATASQNKPT
ncbi:MAG: DUF445 family protein [Bacteroidetes bacterium]|nr:MAG: DUF445 family protein [Bacteroidota bacterium]